MRIVSQTLFFCVCGQFCALCIVYCAVYCSQQDGQLSWGVHCVLCMRIVYAYAVLGAVVTSGVITRKLRELARDARHDALARPPAAVAVV